MFGQDDIVFSSVSNDSGKLVLFDNVQFIYELALAQLELQSLGVRFEIRFKRIGWKQDRTLQRGYEKEFRGRCAGF